MKLLLTGYRATGKTTLGRELATRIGVDFVDTDQLVESQAGKSVAEIVAESGWPAFRAMENDALRQVVFSDDDAVVACGGGAVLHKDVFSQLPPNVVTVWLQLSPDAIVERISNDARSATLRPALGEDLRLEDEVRHVLEEREPLYERYARFVLDTGSRAVPELVGILEEIWRQESE